MKNVESPGRSDGFIVAHHAGRSGRPPLQCFPLHSGRVCSNRPRATTTLHDAAGGPTVRPPVPRCRAHHESPAFVIRTRPCRDSSIGNRMERRSDGRRVVEHFPRCDARSGSNAPPIAIPTRICVRRLRASTRPVNRPAPPSPASYPTVESNLSYSRVRTTNSNPDWSRRTGRQCRGVCLALRHWRQRRERARGASRRCTSRGLSCHL